MESLIAIATFILWVIAIIIVLYVVAVVTVGILAAVNAFRAGRKRRKRLAEIRHKFEIQGPAFNRLEVRRGVQNRLRTA